MAITNYTDLQSTIADYLARSDLTSQIPTFIQLTEAKLKRKFKDVTSLSGAVTTNWLLSAHPDVYLYGALLEAQPYLQDDARIATWAQIFDKIVAEVRKPDSSSSFTTYTGLKAAVADWLARPDLADVVPNFITLAEAKLKRKFRDVTSLSSSVSSNWLLTNHPDAYLYGSLIEAEPYIKDDARIAVWKAEYDEILLQIRLPNTSSNFTNYTGLKYMLSDYLGRPDLDNIIPTFITLGEARLRRDLRIRPMLKVVTTNMTANDPTIALPSDFLEMRDMHIESSPIQTLVYQNPSNFYRNTKASTVDSGAPKFYTVMGSEFQFAPIPDSEYILKMVYYASPSQLSATNSSNVFLANCPDLLLYASLGEAEPYLMNDARIQTWATLYDRGVNSLTISDSAGENPSAPMVISLATR